MPTTIVVCARESRSGKTTWICALLSALQAKGLRVGTVKHTHKDFDVPGKDSARHRDAGAERVILSALNGRAVLIPMDEPPLDEIVAQTLADMDIVLAEGFRGAGPHTPRILVTDDPAEASNYDNVVLTVPCVNAPPDADAVAQVVGVVLDIHNA